MAGCAFVWCVVCVCVISFLCLFCQVHLCGHPRFLCVVVCVFVIKGAWWMPWHAEPMKDVKGCVKPRGVVNKALIRGCPNGETWPWLCGVTLQ